MRVFDGAEICELVHLYALSKLKNRLKIFSIQGLYRDEGLVTLQRQSLSRAHKAKKRSHLGFQRARPKDNDPNHGAPCPNQPKGLRLPGYNT